MKPHSLHESSTSAEVETTLAEDCLKKTLPSSEIEAMNDISLSGSTPFESGGEEEEEDLSKLLHGLVSVTGRSRAMEDTVKVERELFGGEFQFFAVFDGHGGSRVSDMCRERMHCIVARQIEGRIIVDWEEVMRVCFAEMDKEVNGDHDGNKGEAASGMEVGSTAVVVMVGKEEVVVANCGDSRAVLCCGGVALPLSIDHKPDRPDETERVEAAGGRIINWNGSRVCGLLATSRSIGDQHLRPYVISEPEVTVTKRTGADEFLIIATDGLWDMVSNKVACDFVRDYFNGQIRKSVSVQSRARKAATMLAELAMAKGSADNISVIIVELKR
ncbi:hypothetical protein LguiA_015769 [Lonicera macranthoides]